MKTIGSRASHYIGVIYILLALTVSGCTEETYSPNTIQFKKVDYDNALPPNSALETFKPTRHIFPVVERDNIIGLPDSLEEMTVWHDFIYRDQYFYYAYKNGIWSKEGFNSMNPPIDSTKQTSNWVDCVATVAFGKDSNDEWVVILDKNNNEDLSDDDPISFNTDTLRFQGNEMILKRARINLSFEIYRNGRILRQSEPFILSYDPQEGITSLGLSYDEYRRGTWYLDPQHYNVGLFTFGYKAKYNPGEFTYLLVDLNRDGQFDIIPGSNESYRTDRPFNIEGITWEVDSIATDGSKLYVSKADTSVLPELALRKGIEAPNFSASTIYNKPFELHQLKEKYVLLDFWGSWCGPCLEEIPNLKKAYQRFSEKNFEIVGISVDRSPEHVREFVESKNMTWTQIFEEYGSENQTISNLYGVTGYPTQYLISPEGKIIAYGSELRGEQLLKTLDKEINQ